MDNSTTSPVPAMLANGAFSIATGLLAAIAPSALGGWLGVSIDGWLRLLGIALIGHGVLLFVLVRRPDVRRWARVNLAMIAPYPFLMVGLVAFGVIDRGLGQGLVLADGLIVGLIAIGHWLGLRNSAAALHPQPA